MPTISAHLPKDWPHGAALAARLIDYRGKPARYLLALIERDLRQRATKTRRAAALTSPTPIP